MDKSFHDFNKRHQKTIFDNIQKIKGLSSHPTYEKLNKLVDKRTEELTSTKIFGDKTEQVVKENIFLNLHKFYHSKHTKTLKRMGMITKFRCPYDLQLRFSRIDKENVSLGGFYYFYEENDVFKEDDLDVYSISYINHKQNTKLIFKFLIDEEVNQYISLEIYKDNKKLIETHLEILVELCQGLQFLPE